MNKEENLSFLPCSHPFVIIQAPVVLAARKSPFFNTPLSFGCNSKFAIPPSIDITRRGNFKFHTRKNNFNTKSGRVSCERRRY